MRKYLLFFLLLAYCCCSAQTPKTYSSAEILLQLKKLKVLGSVLYIAAHPDDENTRLLAYLAKEKLYRTGYLSLTRGDGGQNLIGDEQGVELGLIRTQELLAARRIDDAEQFFSSAYDFGFSKRTEEALATWDHDKVLADVVWVIRKFQPDVIITRFPPDKRAGHGHHSASAVLAAEAFTAAANPSKFPEQFPYGVKPWQAKRLLWNTANFGGNNLTSEDQFKVDVGGYNPLLGKSYGEIAAESRSQHKSQGFGVAAQRGTSMEYFSITKGDAPVHDLFDGIRTGWNRVGDAGEYAIQKQIDAIIAAYSYEHPEKTVLPLVRLYRQVKQLKDGYWKEQKLKDMQQLIEACSGLFLEATTNTPDIKQGDSVLVSVLCNNRLGVPVSNAGAYIIDTHYVLDSLKKNTNVTAAITFRVPDKSTTQPYWLQQPMSKGSFTISDQQLIGKAENDPPVVDFVITIDGEIFSFHKPVRYKYTDPVKGELYQPVAVLPARQDQQQIKRVISYDHIPRIVYFKTEEAKTPLPAVKITGNKVGYIEGAGDKVVAALQEMGYEVTLLSDKELEKDDLSKYQAIITGVRAYNVRASLDTYYDRLMKYIEDGGNLIVQYNTSNNLGPLKARIGPYPFTISRNRITEENAAIKILYPESPVLNFPNKITAADFEGWVQERSIYHAQNWDSHYTTLFAMHDEGEPDDEGSLIMTGYGKGHFIYTGLVFYRELPARVPGTYRLLANMIAL